MSATLSFVRTVVFRVAIPIAAGELAVGGIMIANTIIKFNSYFIFNALGVAAAALTIFSLLPMLVVPRYRDRSFITMISVEVTWTFILWVLWLATAADTVSVLPNNVCLLVFDTVFNTFDFNRINPLDSVLCPETQAFTALAFLSWILLFTYNMTLLCLVFRQQLRGHKDVWSGYVLETDFSAPAPGPSTAYPTPTEPKQIIQGGVVNGVPYQHPPAAQSQDGGYVGQPVVVTNVPQLTGTTVMTNPIPEV